MEYIESDLNQIFLNNVDFSEKIILKLVYSLLSSL